MKTTYRVTVTAKIEASNRDEAQMKFWECVDDEDKTIMETEDLEAVMPEELKKVALRDDVEREILAILSDVIYSELDVAEGRTVAEIAREVLLNVPENNGVVGL